MAERLEIWKTKDNRQFFSKEEAEKHEELFDFFEECKNIFCQDCESKECKIDYEMNNGERILTTNINECDCSKSFDKSYIEEMLLNYRYLKNHFNAVIIKESQKDKVFKQDVDKWN